MYQNINIFMYITLTTFFMYTNVQKFRVGKIFYMFLKITFLFQ